MPEMHTTTIKLSTDDRALLEQTRLALGLSNSEVFRLALREYRKTMGLTDEAAKRFKQALRDAFGPEAQLEFRYNPSAETQVDLLVDGEVYGTPLFPPGSHVDGVPVDDGHPAPRLTPYVAFDVGNTVRYSLEDTPTGAWFNAGYAQIELDPRGQIVAIPNLTTSIDHLELVDGPARIGEV